MSLQNLSNINNTTTPAVGARLALEKALFDPSAKSTDVILNGINNATSTTTDNELFGTSKDDSVSFPAPKMPVKELEEKINKMFSEQKKNLSLNFDLESSGAVRSVQLLDSKTKEVVIQYPSEAVLQVRANLEKLLTKPDDNSKSGVLLSEKA